MFVYNESFKRSSTKFIRHHLYDKRLLFLETSLDSTGGYAYGGDDSMPFGWPTSPRSVIDGIIHLDSINHSPITIIIDSPGGAIDAFLRLYDLIQVVKPVTPICTVGMGLIASAAVPILTGGTLGMRFIFAHSRTMMHPPEGAVSGQGKVMRRRAEQVGTLEVEYLDIISRHTGHSHEEISRVIEEQGEYWMSARESKDFNLVDYVINNLSEFYIPQKD